MNDQPCRPVIRYGHCDWTDSEFDVPAGSRPWAGPVPGHSALDGDPRTAVDADRWSAADGAPRTAPGAVKRATPEAERPAARNGRTAAGPGDSVTPPGGE